MAFTPSLHDFDAGRVGDCDFLSGEDHGTPCIAEYSHAEEIVCKCRHDGTEFVPGVRCGKSMVAVVEEWSNFPSAIPTVVGVAL